MLFIIYECLMAGVKRSIDERDSIAEIIRLKGGEAPDIFRLRQFNRKKCFLY